MRAIPNVMVGLIVILVILAEASFRDQPLLGALPWTGSPFVSGAIGSLLAFGVRMAAIRMTTGTIPVSRRTS